MAFLFGGGNDAPQPPPPVQHFAAGTPIVGAERNNGGTILAAVARGAQNRTIVNSGDTNADYSRKNLGSGS